MLAAADFFTVEVWTPRGLVTFYVFFVVELATRRIDIAGITPNPDEAWMIQVGRNLTDPVDGFLAEKELLILDRDSRFSPTFRDLLAGASVDVVRLPFRSPNLNAYAERFVRSIKEECLGRMIFFGERSLRKVTRDSKRRSAEFLDTVTSCGRCNRRRSNRKAAEPRGGECPSGLLSARVGEHESVDPTPSYTASVAALSYWMPTTIPSRAYRTTR